jgi:hypothetical protein
LRTASGIFTVAKKLTYFATEQTITLKDIEPKTGQPKLSLPPNVVVFKARVDITDTNTPVIFVAGNSNVKVLEVKLAYNITNLNFEKGLFNQFSNLVSLNVSGSTNLQQIVNIPKSVQIFDNSGCTSFANGDIPDSMLMARWYSCANAITAKKATLYLDVLNKGASQELTLRIHNDSSTHVNVNGVAGLKGMSSADKETLYCTSRESLISDSAIGRYKASGKHCVEDDDGQQFRAAWNRVQNTILHAAFPVGRDENATIRRLLGITDPAASH